MSCFYIITHRANCQPPSCRVRYGACLWGLGASHSGVSPSRHQILNNACSFSSSSALSDSQVGPGRLSWSQVGSFRMLKYITHV